MLKILLNKILTFLDPPPYLIQSKKVTSGTDSFHNGNLSIRGRGEIIIGNYCAFGKNISIISENHDINFASIQGHIYKKTFNDVHPGDLDFPNPNKIKGPIEIGNDVWIGDNAVILSGVKIGNGSCIAAGSVVTRDVPPFGIAGGVPAKLIKYRFSPEIISFLTDINWWSWEKKKRQQNKAFFYANLNEISLDNLRKMVQ